MQPDDISLQTSGQIEENQACLLVVWAGVECLGFLVQKEGKSSQGTETEFILCFLFYLSCLLKIFIFVCMSAGLNVCMCTMTMPAA